MAQCPELTEVSLDSIGDFVQADLQLISLYKSCSATHSALVQWIDKSSKGK